MKTEDSKFKVNSVFHIPGRPETFIAGSIQEGTIQSGMQAKVLVDGELYMVADIKSLESIRDAHRSDLVLALDTPEMDTQELWTTLCCAGDTIDIQRKQKS